jgi:hypothetical protein
MSRDRTDYLDREVRLGQSSRKLYECGRFDQSHMHSISSALVFRADGVDLPNEEISPCHAWSIGPRLSTLQTRANASKRQALLENATQYLMRMVRANKRQMTKSSSMNRAHVSPDGEDGVQTFNFIVPLTASSLCLSRNLCAYAILTLQPSVTWTGLSTSLE